MQPTICRDCEHYSDQSVRWHNYYVCMASVESPACVATDRVTGAVTHYAASYMDCYDVNNGRCRKFTPTHPAPRPIRWWQFWRRG